MKKKSTFLKLSERTVAARKAAGVLAIVLALGLVLAGCEDMWPGDGKDGDKDKQNKAATPTASPGAGAVAGNTEITLETTTDGAFIWYTTDGTNPSGNTASNYSPTKKPNISAKTTIKAIARKSDMTDSDVLTVEYTIIGGSLTWTKVMDTTFTGSVINGVAYGGASGSEKFVAAGADGRMAISTDGTTWIGISATDTTFGFNQGINGVAYGGGKWVAAGASGKMATSTDGTSWTAVTNSSFSSTNITAIAYSGGKWVAAGASGKMATSTDGASWTAVTNSSFSSTNITAIAYGGGKWVAAGDSGKMATSTDGTTWTAVSNSLLTGNYIYGVAYGGISGSEKFVAACTFDTIAHSMDGTAWTVVSIPKYPNDPVSTFRGVAYGGGKFVAVGSVGSGGGGGTIIAYANAQE